jgi:hypothetical protein
MIRMFGPCNPRHVYGGPDLQRLPENPFCISANHLAEALKAYETHFSVTIEPWRELLPGQTDYKYFNVVSPKPRESGLVDIHVFRGEEEICPRQNIDFVLVEGDIVEMGTLAC